MCEFFMKVIYYMWGDVVKTRHFVKHNNLNLKNYSNYFNINLKKKILIQVFFF